MFSGRLMAIKQRTSRKLISWSYPYRIGAALRLAVIRTSLLYSLHYFGCGALYHDGQMLFGMRPGIRR
jgi:hypothetical protein